jgi:hypothetical protein
MVDVDDWVTDPHRIARAIVANVASEEDAAAFLRYLGAKGNVLVKDGRAFFAGAELAHFFTAHLLLREAPDVSALKRSFAGYLEGGPPYFMARAQRILDKIAACQVDERWAQRIAEHGISIVSRDEALRAGLTPTYHAFTYYLNDDDLADFL